MASLDCLSDGEIRSRLGQYGYSVGPVTATTRKVLLKKLKNLMAGVGGGGGGGGGSGGGGSGGGGGGGGGGAGTASYDPRCAVTNFSSGEESDGGPAKRKSMPPPKPSARSPARKRGINSSEAPLASSTLVEPQRDAYSPAAAAATTTAYRRSTLGISDFAGYRPVRLSPEPDYREPSPPAAAPAATAAPLSRDLSFLSSRLNNSPYTINDGFRSRLLSSNSFSASSSSPTASPSYHSNQPYSSEFARRLSTLQSSRIGVSSTSSTNRLLDVKESDDEDNGTVPVYTKYSQSGVKGSAMQSRSSGRVTQDSWFSCDSPVSALLVVFFLLFFLAIGATYINMHSVETGVSISTGLNKPICSDLSPNKISGVDCIEERDINSAAKLFWIVNKELSDRALHVGCNGVGGIEPLKDDNIVILAAEQDKTMSTGEARGNIGNLKVLIKSNPSWKMADTANGIILTEAPASLKCYLFEKLTNAAQWLLKLSFIAAIVFVGYRGAKWWMWRNAKYKDEVYKLVSSIVDIVSSKAQEGNGFIPISHVRDQIISPMDRNKMAKLWNDAVTLLESDSRLRIEVQLVEGEEFQVWRWLASPLNLNKRKVWQGQAFETVEGSVNSLPDSPTAYLKIRHMFDPALEEGDDWVTTVRDAILEKCGDANILHVFVEKQSREGCVYIKCASPRDAGIAYRALHGSWFDSKLVTVKYIREKRYLERFPDSAKNIVPLQPSNDNKNSLQ